MTSRSFKYFRHKKHMIFLYRLAGIMDDYHLCQLKIMQLKSGKKIGGKLIDLEDLEAQLPVIEAKALHFIQ